MCSRHGMLRFSAVLLGLCLFMLCGSAFAQGATPIAIGQNASGQLSADSSTAQYSIAATGRETATIQVLALAAGFAPSLRLTNPSGVEIFADTNAAGAKSLSGGVSFADAGTYILEVGSADGSFGQFALLLQPGAALPAAVSLVANQLVSATVGSATPVQVYQFSTGASDAIALTIVSQQDTGALISLFDVDTNRTIATNDAELNGIAYRLPPPARHYRVEIHAGEGGDVAYTICLGDCDGGSRANSAPPPAQTPEAAACTVTPRVSGSVNLRSGPGTQYVIAGNLPAGQVASVLGINRNNGTWYQVNASGTTGWVSSTFVTLAGECTALPSVAAPANAPLAPTSTPTPLP